MDPLRLQDADLLDALQSLALAYFVSHDPASGLVPDRSAAGAPVSVAGLGFALAVYPIAVERRGLPRPEAGARTLALLRTIASAPQDEKGIGVHGFYYHFLDPVTAARVWSSEVSLVDSAFLIAGALVASAYFDADDGIEKEIRDLAWHLYRRAEWDWAMNGGRTLSHGWKPECGFLDYSWDGYNEAILLYALALGSPTHPIPSDTYGNWTVTYQWERLYGIDHLYAGPLFIHLFSHAWIDFRGVTDGYMREKRCDYAENTRRAILVQREYGRRNPRGHLGYSIDGWGWSAGPGPDRALFLGYSARGVPYGEDDGTLSPATVAAALPFAPDLVLRALRGFLRDHPAILTPLGISSGLNPSAGEAPERAWIAEEAYAIDQGTVALMLENHRSGLPWELVRRVAPIRKGLKRAGFSGGWLR
jgi:hypothetical protein